MASLALNPGSSRHCDPLTKAALFGRARYMRASSYLRHQRQNCQSSSAPTGWKHHLGLQQVVQQHILTRQKVARPSFENTRAWSKLEALKYAARQSSKHFPLQQTLEAVALPPDDVPALGPRVEHIIAKNAGTLSAILSSQLLLPEVSQDDQHVYCS